MTFMFSMAKNGDGCRKDGRVGRIVNSHKEHREKCESVRG